MKIGYLGPDGTFSQQAVLLYQKTVTDKKTTLLSFPAAKG